MDDSGKSGQLKVQIGWCALCRHARTVKHPRGGADYWRCARADDDPQLARYPRLPVEQCAAFADESEKPFAQD